MKTLLLALAFAVSTARSDSPIVPAAPSPAPPGRMQRLETPDQVPDGLSPSDWSSIRRQFEQQRHALVAVEGGHCARNPGQQWQTHFDRRGFLVQPEGAGWQWGLELQSYGFAGHERTVSGEPQVTTKADRIEYAWDNTMQEWFINDRRGLEHGFTLKTRPPGAPARDSQPVATPEQRDGESTLNLLLAVRGGLRPELETDGRGVRFVDAQGVAAVTYGELTVLDAAGRKLTARFERAAADLRVAIDDRNARYPVTIDPIAQTAYLKASNTGSNDWFASVAVSGDTVVVGAHREASSATGVNGNQSDNSAPDAGAAYVFVRNGAAWTQQAYLKAFNTDAYDSFGSVAISGDTVVVGANGEASSATGVNGNQSDNSAPYAGAAYVFVRNGTNWTQQAYLKASNTEAGDQFGGSVAVFGDTVVVGAIFEDSSATGVNGNQSDNSATYAGAAYVFTRSGTNWTQQAYLKASNTGANDNFGSVAMSGDTVVVGANGEDSSAIGVNGNQGDNSAPNSGAAYVFVRNGTTWTQQAYLKASNTGANDNFGGSVAVSGDTMVVGAGGEDSSAIGVNGNQSDNSAPNSGAAYVFVRSGTTWTQQAYLKASNAGANDYFGSVAVSGDTVVVGAYGEASSATGVNGSQSDNSAPNSGAAYVFVRNGTTWAQQAYLKASNTGASDTFGGPVAVFGDRVVVGANGEASSATGVNGNQSDNTSQYSGAAYIFDLNVPDITAQPTNQLVLTGNNAVFSVSATSLYPPLSYQWQFNGTNINAATNDSLTIMNVQLANSGDYIVLVSDGKASISSAPANLSLINAAPPTVTTLSATNLSQNNASVRGSVNPNGGATTVYYQYGLSAAYGSQTPAFNLAAGANTIAVSNALTGLMPSTTYHYRLVAANSGGTNYGGDLSFTTLDLSPGGYAMSFDGANGYVSVPNFGLSLPTNEITIEFWQRPAERRSQRMFMLIPDMRNNRMTASVPWDDGVVYWDFGNGDAGGRLLYTPTTNIIGNWHHFAMVLSRAGNFQRIYRDGVLDASKASAQSFVRYPAALWIGNDDSFQAFKGEMDEFRIWSVARTQSEIQQSMNTPLLGTETNLFAYWRFDEVPGSAVAADSSGHGQNGNLSNGVTRVASTAPLTALTPMLSAPIWQANQFSLSATTASGSVYYLERTTSLSSSNWNPVTNLPGNGLLRSLSDPAATNAQGFYRVRIQ